MAVDAPSLRDAALRCAARGWPVFACHGIIHGRCTCGKPDCGSAGKHPRTAHGVLDATANQSQIRTWWGEWPDSNVAIATGIASGLVVLDVDGSDGKEALAELEQQHSNLPPTHTVSTGGGGLHFYFAYPQARLVRNPAGPWPGYSRRWGICRSPSIAASLRQALHLGHEWPGRPCSPSGMASEFDLRISSAKAGAQQWHGKNS